MTYSKSENFDTDTQELASFFKVLSHPARLAILMFLAEQKQCISGDISNEIPLSRTTVSQHLQELKNSGMIHGSISGTRVNYCLCNDIIIKVKKMAEKFLNEIDIDDIDCKI